MNFNKLKQAYIIAEIGINHQGKLKIAKNMVDKAKDAGVNAVKFQCYKTESVVSEKTPKIKYQKKNSKDKQSHFQMLKECELSENDFKFLKIYCKKKKIDFISSSGDVQSFKFLKKIGMDIFKLASADLTDLFLNQYLASIKKNIIISTGMANIKEIKETLKFYKNISKNKICLMHCVSNYPCDNKSLNLKVLPVLKKMGYTIGFSDHTNSNIAAITSLSLGAKIFEKHFTLDKNMKGPDHKASVDYLELKKYVNDLREAEKSLGKPIKACQSEEKQMRLVARKSIFTKKKILKNTKLKLEDVCFKRPGNGISPMQLNNVLNRVVKSTIPAETKISFKLLKK